MTRDEAVRAKLPLSAAKARRQSTVDSQHEDRSTGRAADWGEVISETATADWLLEKVRLRRGSAFELAPEASSFRADDDLNAKPARISRRSHPANQRRRIGRFAPHQGLSQPIATYCSRGPVHCLSTAQSCQSATAAACASFPQGEPASHPPPTAAPKVTKPSSSQQPARPRTRPAPELPTPHQVRVLQSSPPTRLLSDGQRQATTHRSPWPT